MHGEDGAQGRRRQNEPAGRLQRALRKRGTELTATVQLEGEAAYIELPLLYYPGYRAEIDGQAQTVARGTEQHGARLRPVVGRERHGSRLVSAADGVADRAGRERVGRAAAGRVASADAEARMTELRASVRQVVEFSLHERDLSPGGLRRQAHAGGRGGAQGAAKARARGRKRPIRRKNR